ncbi:MAG TPA: hypothetical protein VJM50_02495 [Pyrinomonadaceae bacterium]|nr:hypothetical protein [Pyrinomonadaceae bacterium]
MVEAIYSMLNGWSEIDRYTAVALFLGFIGICVNMISVRKASAQAALLLENAGSELKRNIKSQITKAGRIVLLSGSAVRQIALDIQVAMHSPVITDPMIAESIREVILEVEKELTGPEQARRIKVLENVLREFEPQRVQPMSIAFTDRVFAYRLSVLGLSLVLLSLQFILTSVSSKYLLPALAVWILPLFQLLLFYSNVRAFQLWKKQGSVHSSMVKQPVNPHRLIDFLLRQTMTTHHSVHTAWAPVWEELMFRLMPLHVLPIFGAWTAYQISKSFGFDEYSLRSIVKWTVIVMFLVGLYISVFVFSNWHKYRYFEVKRLEREFDRMRKEVFVARFRQLPLSKEHFEKYINLSRRIWSITGLSYFREAEKKL